MANSRIVDGERRYDPNDDLGYIPKYDVGRFAVAEAKKRRKKRDLAVEIFIDANLGFVPESRGAIAVALVSPEYAIDDIYKKTIKYQDTHPKIRGRQIRAYHKKLTARQSWTNLELGQLTDANARGEKNRFDPSTFNVGSLKSSSSAMEVVAMHELRASALAQSDWANLDSDMIEKTKRDELDFMSTLTDDELTKRWLATWESINNEYTFWCSMVYQTEHNQKANIYIPNLTDL